MLLWYWRKPQIAMGKPEDQGNLDSWYSVTTVDNVRGINKLLSYSATEIWALLRKWKKAKVSQPCPTLCDPMNCSLPGSSIHGIFQARVLEWGAIASSRRSSQPRDWTWVSRIVDRCFTVNGQKTLGHDYALNPIVYTSKICTGLHLGNIVKGLFIC